MSAFRDIELIPYLLELEKNFAPIRKEIMNLEENYAEIQEMIKSFLYPNPKSKLPQTTDTWMTFAFYALGKKATDLARELHCTQTNENPTDEELEAFCATLEK
ncbi:hypothetical protein BH24PSE2_BH24PSE2_15360 [soil metagenome]